MEIRSSSRDRFSQRDGARGRLPTPAPHMEKRALLVACNYPGTSAELHGCVNDVLRMHTLLVEQFGFKNSDIEVMIDTDERYVQPTGKNIKSALAQLVAASTEGDVLFFHYSGHGTLVPAESGHPDDDKKDEAIVPTDLNLLTDDDFRLIFKPLAAGVHFTFISDSCHSGGLLDSVEVQIGVDADEGEIGAHTVESDPRAEMREFSYQDAYRARQSHRPGVRKAKSLSMATLTQMLSQRTGHEVQTGHIRTTLYDMFADDSSPKVKVFINLIEQRIQEGYTDDQIVQRYGQVGAAAYEYIKSKLDDENVDNQQYLSGAHNLPQSGFNTSGHANTKPDSSEQLEASTGVLVSGCQSNETSADAHPGGDLTKAYGALSNGIQEILAQYEGTISNSQLVNAVRRQLRKEGFAQHPCLFCSDQNVNVPFICERVAYSRPNIAQLAL